MRWKISVLAAAAALALPALAHAQGVIGGSEQGAAEGAHDAGPVGGVIGGVVGGVTGGVAGLLGADDYPRFHRYIVEQDIPSYSYQGPVRVGVILPDEDIHYYDVPPEFHVAPGYQYTVIDNEPVIVDHSRRVVEVID
ncbi:MAG: DUF1236 domain-containing protein [Methylovirgula sp.]|jgi:hypothetical protein